MQSQPPNGSEHHHAPRQTTGTASSRGNGYHGLQPDKQLQLWTDETQTVWGTEDTYPPRPTTGPSPRTPPSLPAGPSSSAAGCATPAPRGCGTVRGASAGRGGRDRSAGPSPAGPGRDRMGWGHGLSHSLSCHAPRVYTFFSSLLASSVPSFQIKGACADYDGKPPI